MATKKTTTRKPAKKATTRRITPVLKKAAPDAGAAVTLVLSPENNGCTVASLIASLSRLHPKAPVEFSAETFQQRQSSASVPLPNPDNPVRAGGLTDLLLRNDELLDTLERSISFHADRLEPVLAAARPSNETNGEAPTPDLTDIGTRIYRQSRRLYDAIERIESLSERTVL